MYKDRECESYSGEARASLLGLCSVLDVSNHGSRGKFPKSELVEKLVRKLLEQLRTASASAAAPSTASAGTSLLSNYIKMVQGELRRQHG